MSSSKNSKKKQVRGLDPRRHRSEYYWNKANSEDSSSEESTLKEGTMMQKWRKRPWGARRLWWLQTKPRSLPRANPKSCRCKQRAAIRPKKQMERTMIEQQCQEEATYQIMTRSDKYFLMLKGMSNSNMALCQTFSEWYHHISLPSNLAFCDLTQGKVAPSKSRLLLGIPKFTTTNVSSLCQHECDSPSNGLFCRQWSR